MISFLPANPFADLAIDYTALDALQLAFDNLEPSPHCLLAEVCVEWLEYSDLPGRYSKDLSKNWKKSRQLAYACDSWHRHAEYSIERPAQADARPVAAILHFLASCQAFPLKHHNSTGVLDVFSTPIHLVTFYHLPSLLPLVAVDVNKRTRKGRSALSLAALQNDAVMVKLLLKLDGIDVNLRDNDKKTALMIADQRGWRFDNVAAILRRDPRVKVDSPMYRRHKLTGKVNSSRGNGKRKKEEGREGSMEMVQQVIGTLQNAFSSEGR